MWIVRHKKIFFIISGILLAASIALIAAFGLRFGIEFSGGTLVEATFTERPEKAEITPSLENIREGISVQLQTTGDGGYLVRTPFLSEDEQGALTSTIEAAGGTVERISSIGPSIGNELRSKAAVAIAVVLLVIILFVAYAFRKVSEPVSSWKYGFVAIGALIHDVLIPTGAFALLGHLVGYEVDVLFVMALLAILGYSVNDTIVVFDRIRENLQINSEKNTDEPFEETVGRSLSQTYTRSINTSLTTVLVLVALYIFGATSTEHFALTLIIGAIAGTYSSIFFASPLLVQIEKWQRKKES
ncbi:MAG: protein translocase subunit SecF [Candidatus Paceibacterota bacterium]